MRDISKLLTKFKKKKVLLCFIVIITFIFIVSFSGGIFLRNPLPNGHLEQRISASHQVFKTENDSNRITESVHNDPTLTNNPSKKVLGINTINSPPTQQQVTGTDRPVPSPVIPSPTIGQIISPQINKPTDGPSTYPPATPTAAPSGISAPIPTATPIVTAAMVSVEIKTPESSSNFSVELKDGMNVCDVLQKAKDEGKINSLTIDDSYLSNFKSRYVVEINGYKNNWTFTVNGVSPLGCSLSNPKSNDIIIWKIL